MSLRRNRLFHPFDLIFPIGLGIAALGLGIWAAIASDAPPVGKIIAVATGLVFASMNIVIYVWRAKARKSDFITSGVRVRMPKRVPGAQPLKARDVNNWIDWVIHFWAKDPISSTASEAALKDLLVVFGDRKKYGSAGRWMRAYYQGSVAVIGRGKDIRDTLHLFAHELGHAFLDGRGIPWDKHHDLMEHVEYDARIAAASVVSASDPAPDKGPVNYSGGNFQP